MIQSINHLIKPRKVFNMKLEQYIAIYKSHPKWELLNIKKALSSLGGFLNSDDDNIRLEAVITVLKMKRQGA
jgi:hypothetical protein